MICEFPDDARFVLARSIIVDAGALAQSYFVDPGALGVEHKLNGQDVVSIADRAVEALIRARIGAAFPEDGFLGEETGLDQGTSGYVWVVDPIDGTSCFVHGLTDWCVSIALTRGDTTEFGLVNHLANNELFVAARGQGAFLNGASIHVDTAATLATGLTGLGANLRVSAASIARFAEGLVDAGGIFYRNGSGALMLTYVACGRLVAYYEGHINSWDCLAALCLIREAGGWTADFPEGTRLLEGGPVIASAPQVREQLLALVKISQGASPL